MSEQDVANVRQLFHALNEPGGAPPSGVLADDVELHTPLANEHGSPYAGAAAFSTWLSEAHERLPGFTFEPEDIVERGGRVLVTGLIEHEGLDVAPGYSAPAAWVVDVKAGKVARVELFMDPDLARSACEEPSPPA